MSDIFLSVLIPSIPSRLDKLYSLIGSLEAQSDPQLEVLVLLDNKRRPLGSKRNELMRMAQGKYLCHIDDDEGLAPDFFSALRPELAHNADVIGYDAGVSLNGSPEFRVRTVLGAENEQPKHLPNGHYSDIVRNVWHWCAWRTSFARQFSFPDHYDGAEDAYWLKQAWPKIQTWRKVERVLFRHNYNASSSTFPTS